MNVLLIILWSIIGYLIGSIPWALIIGKFFYHKDIREYGSGNLGGSNAGRVLGGKIGVIVIILDGLKAFVVMMLAAKFYAQAILYAGAAACIGHCFPLFAKFKGGKGVATFYGFLLGLGYYGIADFIFIFICPVLIFFFILGLSKLVALASLTALIITTIIGFLTIKSTIAAVLILILTCFIIYRHHSNIVRLFKKEEPKITWLK